MLTRCKNDVVCRSTIGWFLRGLKLGSGLLLIVVNCCAAMCVGYMKCLLSLTCSVWCSLSVRTTLQSVPKYLVWFMLSLTKLHRTKLWCWAVIKAVGCMRFLFRHNRSLWCWILTLQCRPEELSDLYSAAGLNLYLSVCADANITETFRIFGRTKFIINFIKVNYKISTMVAFCPGGLLSEWPIV